MLRRVRSKDMVTPLFDKGAFRLLHNPSIEKNKQYEHFNAHIAYSRVMLTLAKRLDLLQLSRLKYLLLL